MDEDSGGPKDLFGDPWTPPRDPRGRKRHRRSPEVAEKVAVLKATGSTHEEIARRLGLSEPTLRKYYLRELEQGDELARQVLVEAQWKKAIAGSTPAAKFIREELAKGASAKFLQKTANVVRAPRLGKKEQAQADAATAGQGSEWGEDLLGAARPN